MRNIALLAFISVSLTACASTGGTPTSEGHQKNAETPTALFAAALHEAAIPTPSVIGPELLRITPDNSKLSWRDGPNGKQVLVASVMPSSSFDAYYKGKQSGVSDILARNWVTAVPQLKEFCTAASGDATAKTARVIQWLGLNPNVPYAQVVEMWISPEMLARPCPIMDVTAAYCTLDNKETASRPVCVGPKEQDPVCLGQAAYWDWFGQNMRNNLKEGGAPWTRLGYTFDWKRAKSGSFERYGASEFITKKDATYQINAAYTLAEYCAAPGS